MAFPIDWNATSGIIADGKGFVPYFPLQLKIGYRF
jgi:hypothetical protein